MQDQSAPVSTEIRDDVAILIIDNPPVNATSQAVRAGLLRAIVAADSDADIHAIVIACAGRTFVAGGDIREFGRPPLSPMLYEVCARIEACAKPVVCALHGTALGGGFEIALASHYRLAARGAQVGLPEVKIGLVPGAGGSQRLPRLSGIPFALDLASTGRFATAEEALERGAIDEIVDGDIREAAISRAQTLAGKPFRRTGELPAARIEPAEAQTLLDGVRRKARRQESPVAAAGLVLESAQLTTAQGVAREREEFTRLMDTQQGRALRYVFIAEREAARVPGTEGVVPREIRIVGVAGAGTMGTGIAVALAEAGYAVVVVEQNAQAAERGRARIEGMFARNVAAGRLNETAKAERMARIATGYDPQAFSTCDLVIEAVFDNLPIKRKLFEDLSRIVRADCILATNTSYLDPNAIAANVADQSRVLGMHFFAPANIMRLLEIVRAQHTSAEILASAIALGKKLRKLPVVSGVCTGFIGNRIYSFYRKQCEFMLEEGALPHEIDHAMESFGLPMGPFRAFDLSGLDIAWALRKRQAATRDPAARYSHIADRLCEMDRFGQKTQAGWYRYDDGKPVPDPAVETIIVRAAEEKNVARHNLSSEEIRTRLIAAMANEGAKILEEGIAMRQSDIDLVYLNGYGWPGWLGGPMFQAHEIGLARILREVETMHGRDGPEFAPAQSLVRAAADGSTIEQAIMR